MCTSFDLLRAFHLLDTTAFAETLGAMDRAGALAPYLRDLAPALKLAFLDLCVEQGIVSTIPAIVPDATVAAPPAAPRLLVNRRSLPRALRVLVHHENVTRANRYAGDYRAYLERYCALVDDAETPAALRALGAPAPAYVPASEPGLDFDGDDDLVWDFDRRVERLDDSAITHRVHVKTFQFRAAA